MRGIFHVTVRVVLRTENYAKPENSMPEELYRTRRKKSQPQASSNPGHIGLRETLA